MEKTNGTSVMEHFSSLTDPRVVSRSAHKLIDMVIITVCAVLAGADNWVEIAGFGRAKKDWFARFLELPAGIPSHYTFRRVFARIDPDEFGKCLCSWIREVFPRRDPDVIAIDGKTSRRSHDRTNGKGPIHRVNAWAVENRLVLGQIKTEDKSNEIKAIPELLRIIDIKGCVVTLDAMGCQKEIAAQIIEQGGDYVLALKGNQGNLHKEVNLLFEKAQEDNFQDLPHDSHTTVDGGHGRIETRTYTTIADVDWFEEKEKWPNLSTFARVESEREMESRITRETRYYISSLPNDAKRFGEAIRGHWGVENGLHWCLDIAFREDDSRVRKGNGATNPAIIRRFALSLVKQDPLRKVGVQASRKRAGWDDQYLLDLLRV